VLNVDLWDEHGQQEVNLVRHSNSTPAISISAATVAPYPPPPERPYLGLLAPAELHAYYTSIGEHATAASLERFIPNRTQVATNMYGQPLQPGQQGYAQYPGQPQSYMQASTVPVPIMAAPTQGMFTRNLIGSLSVNASRLADDQGKIGIWFVLQDLSVRTEGVFRYVCFLNVLFTYVGEGVEPCFSSEWLHSVFRLSLLDPGCWTAFSVPDPQ
jgi:hypothetical protein